MVKIKFLFDLYFAEIPLCNFAQNFENGKNIEITKSFIIVLNSSPTSSHSIELHENGYFYGVIVSNRNLRLDFGFGTYIFQHIDQ